MFNFQVKCICIKVLEVKWPDLVKKVDDMISTYTSENECAIVTFLGLWESIISVKANLSVIDTKPFYSNLYSFIVVLNSSVPSTVWKHLLNLFNEVLCYGSTLALQVRFPFATFEKVLLQNVIHSLIDVSLNFRNAWRKNRAHSLITS